MSTDITPLAGKVAAITGAGRGIGLAIAQSLAHAGARIVLLGRDRTRLESARAELGAGLSAGISAGLSAEMNHTHLAIPIDVTNEASVKAAFAEIAARAGRVDILVNNAGQAASAPLHKTTLATFDALYAVNTRGTFLCTREVLPGMAQAGWGRIVNVASTAGLVGYAYVSAYVASKHAVIGMTRALALEQAKTGVTVNAVCPGYTETDLVVDAVANIMKKTGKSETEARAALTASNPQGRMVQPEEVADCVAWLCSPLAAAITGQAIPIAGGEVMTR